MNKTTITLIFFFIVLSFSSLAVINNIVDIMDFENFPESQPTTIYNNYTSFIDEGVGDGTNDARYLLFGSSVIGHQTQEVYFLFTPNEDVTANRIFINLGITIGNPQNYDIDTSISYCRTSVTNLTNANDCDNDFITLNSEYNISRYWGTSTSKVEDIPLKDVTFTSGQSYIILFNKTSNEIDANNYYRIETDTTGIINNYLKVVTNGSTLLYTALPEWYIYYQKPDMGNINAYNKNITCTDESSLSDCIFTGTTGDTDIQIKDNSGDRYLYLSSINGDAQAKQLDVKFNHIDSNNLGSLSDNTHTLYYRMKKEYSSFSFAYADDHFSGLYFPEINVNATRYFTSMMGRRNINNATAWQQLRPVFGAGVNYPETTGCVIGSTWTDINHVLYFNDVNLDRIDTYVNGVLCDSRDVSRNYVNSSSIWTYIRMIAKGDYSIGIDDIYLIEGLYTQSLKDEPTQNYYTSGCVNAPISNCVFYDTMSYNTDTDYRDEDYYNFDFTLNNFVNGSTEGYIYLEEANFYNYIRHNFSTHNYNTISGVYEIKINNTIIPDSLKIENNPLIYKLSVYCSDDSIYNAFYLAFIKDTSFSVDENQTIVNIYVYDDSVQRILGTLIVNNGDNIYIKTKHDTINQETKYTFLTDELVSLGYFPDYNFIVDDELSCSYIQGFEIKKADNNNNDEDFIKFDRIYYQGIIEEDSTDLIDSSPYYENLTGTEISNKTIDDAVNEIAWSLGFRNATSKLIFWFLLMLVTIISLLSYQGIGTTGKTIALSVISLMLIYIGWRMSFIPNILMILIVMVIAIIGALLFQRMFTSTES